MILAPRAVAAAASLRGARVAVTGGLGFIGSNLARALAAAGAVVNVIDVLVPDQGGAIENLGELRSRVSVSVADVRDRQALDETLAGCDVVFALAARTGHLTSMTDPVVDLELNCASALAVLEYIRSRLPDATVVHTSTRQVYGRSTELPLRETHRTRPVDVNGIHKLAAEQYHTLYHDVYELDTRILRLTNVYGPRMRIRDAKQAFIGYWLGLAARGAPIPVYRPGTQRRDLLHVDDAVTALCLAATTPGVAGEVFNVAGSEPVTLLELARLLAAASVGSTVELIDFPEDREKIDVGDCVTDSGKARRLLGWEPEVSLADGLARTLEFYGRSSPAGVRA